MLALVCANAGAQTPLAEADEDGFVDPLRTLDFNPDFDQQVFEFSTSDALDVDDPFERFNRRMYHFNYRLDQWVMLPVVRGYRHVTPSPVRTGVSNFFNNLRDISNLANSVMQLKVERSMRTTARLLFNTILGVGGLWDPATRMGLPRQPEDFGQTLGSYGVPSGPYLVLPAFGPSNLRDATGLLVDYGLERSINFHGYHHATSEYPVLYGLRTVDLRHTTPFRYGQLNSPFEYEQVRYIYNRARQIQILD
ncbi:MlaA family lipoprotein [Stutzerimonas tarimensis]|uniref:VacJ family lipoprotein n=1 Tax=Stutzerimonas tarimensis TaxID=1507735 RepID=A0ABV7T8X0_9GAMM